MLLFDKAHINLWFNLLNPFIDRTFIVFQTDWSSLWHRAVGEKNVRFNSHTSINNFHWLFHLEYFLSKLGLFFPNSDYFLNRSKTSEFGSKFENCPKHQIVARWFEKYPMTKNSVQKWKAPKTPKIIQNYANKMWSFIMGTEMYKTFTVKQIGWLFYQDLYHFYQWYC